MAWESRRMGAPDPSAKPPPSSSIQSINLCVSAPLREVFHSRPDTRLFTRKFHAETQRRRDAEITRQGLCRGRVERHHPTFPCSLDFWDLASSLCCFCSLLLKFFTGGNRGNGEFEAAGLIKLASRHWWLWLGKAVGWGRPTRPPKPPPSSSIQSINLCVSAPLREVFRSRPDTRLFTRKEGSRRDAKVFYFVAVFVDIDPILFFLFHRRAGWRCSHFVANSHQRKSSFRKFLRHRSRWIVLLHSRRAEPNRGIVVLIDRPLEERRQRSRLRRGIPSRLFRPFRFPNDLT